jgi:hypothetical protein
MFNWKSSGNHQATFYSPCASIASLNDLLLGCAPINLAHHHSIPNSGSVIANSGVAAIDGGEDT